MNFTDFKTLVFSWFSGSNVEFYSETVSPFTGMKAEWLWLIIES
jgi:hypothetical protein